MFSATSVKRSARRSLRRRLLTSMWLIFHLLFGQLALAGYVCPLVTDKTPASPDEMAWVAEPAVVEQRSCDEAMSASAMDAELTNLCQAHCEAGDQTLGGTHLAAATLGAPTTPAHSILSSSVVDAATPTQPPDIRRATAPPLAIRHCCWRI